MAAPVDTASPARYAYLVARLRNRQITMEEATELFGLLQGMLRDSQAVRARLEQAAGTATMPSSGSPPSPPTAPAVAAAPRGPLSDDLLLFGLLALGAGVGLGAAFTRRFADSVRPEPAGRTTNSRR